MANPNPHFEEQSSIEISNETPFDVLDKADLTDDDVPGHMHVAAPVNGFELAAHAAGVNDASQIPPRDDVEKTDFDILNERIDELTAMVRHQENILLSHGKGLEYLCNSMQWLTNMMSGVAEVAQKMPGMGGMMARMLAPKGNQG